MITQGSDYAQVTAHGYSNFKPLEKGGYICQIKKAEELTSQNGKPMVHIAFDITEGENKGYFMDLFTSRKERQKKEEGKEFREVKWPFEGQSWVMVNDYEDPNRTSRKFKGFCTALEESGTKVWNDDKSFNLDNLNGAMVGIIFQRVEDEYEGKARWKTIPWSFRSVDSIRNGDFFVPDDKPLENKGGQLEGQMQLPPGFSNVDDDSVPF